MKTNKIILLAAALSFHWSFSQFAKIIDQDGYVNMRKNADAKSSIVGKINSEEIIYVFDPDGNNKDWVHADYTNRKGKTTSRYIHNSRIRYIESYESIPLASWNENKSVFNSKNIQVEIESAPFDYKENKKYFSVIDYNGQKMEDKFKEQQIWGTDGTTPRTHYKYISVKTGKKIVQIPTKEIENLFNVNYECAKCYWPRTIKRYI